MGQVMSLLQGAPQIMVSPPIVTEAFRGDSMYPKFELHLHLDGAVRHSTLLELANQKGMDLKGAKTVEDVKRLLVSHEPANLSKVLAAFDIFLPIIRGDKDAIERVAYEHCENQCKNGVHYFEGRYSPHLLCNTVVDPMIPNPYKGKGELTPRGVIEAVKRGLDRGYEEFKIKSRSILCCIRGHDQWAKEVLELADSCKHLGVVGIDVAGCAHGADEQYEPAVIEVFKEAAKRGIHRTVHAGESGGPKEVIMAIEEMKAERIGHGYRLNRDEDAFQKYAVKRRMHFEACPYSSVMTGSVPLNWPEHPIKRWADDKINFSISTDDPTCFDNCMLSDLLLARDEIGLTEHQLWEVQMNACKATFLPVEEKTNMLRVLAQFEPKK